MTIMVRSTSQVTRPSQAIGMSTASRFSYSSIDWAEDDAWDSASDSESPAHRPKNTSNHSVGKMGLEATVSSPPRAIPTGTGKQNQSQSPSSSLNFSYTHVNAPSPGSYSKMGESIHNHKTSWTIVSKSSENRTTGPSRSEDTQRTIRRKASDEIVVDDFIIAELDEGNETSLRHGSGASESGIRAEAEEIEKGAKLLFTLL